MPLQLPLHPITRSYVAAVRARDHLTGSWRSYPDDEEIVGYYVERIQQLAGTSTHVPQARRALRDLNIAYAAPGGKHVAFDATLGYPGEGPEAAPDRREREPERQTATWAQEALAAPPGASPAPAQCKKPHAPLLGGARPPPLAGKARAGHGPLNKSAGRYYTFGYPEHSHAWSNHINAERYKSSAGVRARASSIDPRGYKRVHKTCTYYTVEDQTESETRVTAGSTDATQGCPRSGLSSGSGRREMHLSAAIRGDGLHACEDTTFCACHRCREGCRKRTRTLRHVSFDATLGYPGEGPSGGGDVEPSVDNEFARLPRPSAVRKAGSDTSRRKRKLADTYDLQDRYGRSFTFESMDSTPEDVVAIQEAVGDGSTDTANLWVGDNMNQVATAEEGFLGTVSFFNVDNLAFGTDAMQQVAAEAAKVRCMIQGIGDHRSDWVNVGGRVEQAYKANYGGSNVRFVHSCCRGSRMRPEIGECSVAIMPELRNRAMNAIRDRRKWGRYAGTLIEGRMVGGVRKRTVFIMVYAACGDTSAAGKAQQAKIDSLVAAGETTLRGKKPFTMLLHDLSWELERWRQKGCTVVVGGDFNQRHDRPGKEWRVLDRWRKRERLGDVLRRLHPSTDFVTYRSHGKRTASGELTKIARRW